jgi:hypothetical protein
MARNKAELLQDAQAAGLVAADAPADDFTVADLEGMLNADRPAWEGSLSVSEPIVAPDGHVVLSREDVDARQ